MLGVDMVEVLREAGHDVVPLGRADLDVTDAQAVDAGLPDADVVVNCAAWTAVDDAEAHEADAFRANAVGPANLARAARRRGARLVQFSTDYVFDGAAESPYPQDAPIAPRSAYGRTKAAGEWAVRAEAPDALVLRTAWLYGASGRCFPKTMARLAAERESLTVVDDQVGQPTWTQDVARLTLALVTAGAPAGTYHATSSGATSWFGFARAVVASAGRPAEMVTPTTSAAFASAAPRPAYSVLDHGTIRVAGVEPIGDWAERWAAASGAVLA
jgi:dTDP-4-dehydrorhamnose reductase